MLLQHRQSSCSRPSTSSLSISVFASLDPRARQIWRRARQFALVEGAAGKAKQLLERCGPHGSKVYVNLRTQNLLSMFEDVTLELDWSLNSLPLMSPQVSDHVRSQVELVTCELRRSKYMTDPSEEHLGEDIAALLRNQREGSRLGKEALEIQKLVWEDRRSVVSNTLPPHLSTGTAYEDLAKQNSDSAIKIVHAKEQEIEKRQVQVREKVQRLSRWGGADFEFCTWSKTLVGCSCHASPPSNPPRRSSFNKTEPQFSSDYLQTRISPQILRQHFPTLPNSDTFDTRGARSIGRQSLSASEQGERARQQGRNPSLPLQHTSSPTALATSSRSGAPSTHRSVPHATTPAALTTPNGLLSRPLLTKPFAVTASSHTTLTV
jgi:hypothetical protein